MIFVGFESGGGSFVELGDGFLEELELAADELHAQGVAFQNGGFVGQGNSFCDLLQTFSDELLAARAPEVIKGFNVLGFSFLQALEGRPLQQKGGGQWTPEIFAAKF